MTRLFIILILLMSALAANAQVLPFKPNLVINGGMDLDRRQSASSAITVTSGIYFVDRFSAAETYTTGAATATQITIPATDAPYLQGLQYAARITATTGFTSPGAGEVVELQHNLEGTDFKLIAQKQATMSFWVRLNHAVSADFPITACIAFKNNGSARSLVSQFTITANNTWYEQTIPIDLKTGTSSGTWVYNNGVGLRTEWAIGAGTNFTTPTANTWVDANRVRTGACSINLLSSTNDTIDFTGIRLIDGTQKLPFVRAGGGTISAEEKLANKYYRRMCNKVNNSCQLAGYNNSTNNMIVPILFDAPMRATPTCAVVGTWSVTNCSQPNVTGVSADGFNLFATVTATNPFSFTNATASSQYIECAAEL